MQYREGRIGRIFVLRLEEGERLPDTIEAFARAQDLQEAMVIYVGGARDGSRLVVGPDAGRPEAIVPLVHTLTGIQEVLGVGTLFPNEAGEPVLHLHAAAGREGRATVGCSRAGVDVWLVGEVILLELVGTQALRRQDPNTGFALLSLT
ncbi:MAG: DNA-binding protein [Deltaproteobacteria bacterium]|nr:DNA-binding protein [Deltaproteobacteria bacterium]